MRGEVVLMQVIWVKSGVVVSVPENFMKPS